MKCNYKIFNDILALITKKKKLKFTKKKAVVRVFYKEILKYIVRLWVICRENDKSLISWGGGRLPAIVPWFYVALPISSENNWRTIAGSKSVTRSSLQRITNVKVAIERTLKQLPHYLLSHSNHISVLRKILFWTRHFPVSKYLSSHFRSFKTRCFSSTITKLPWSKRRESGPVRLPRGIKSTRPLDVKYLTSLQQSTTDRSINKYTVNIWLKKKTNRNDTSQYFEKVAKIG